jgi:hypothetical protein
MENKDDDDDDDEHAYQHQEGQTQGVMLQLWHSLLDHCCKIPLLTK